MTTLITLTLEPLDVLFFRDGRPFAPGAVLTSGRPTPQTLAGALRTWVLDRNGCDFGKLGAAVRKGRSFAEALSEQSPTLGALAAMTIRGPWFTYKGEPIVPAPATLRRVRGDGAEPERVVRLDPLHSPLPGWRSELGKRPLWWRGKDRLEPMGDAFLTMEGVRQFLNGKVPILNGKVPTPEPKEIVLSADLMAHDRRVSVQIASGTGAGVDGALFSSGFLSLKADVGLMAEIRVPAESGAEIPAAAVLPLGGEGRRVAVTRREPFEWPKPEKPEEKDGRRLLLLTTPALFDSDENGGPWKPPGLRLEAAAVPRAEPVSGWDLARGGPKATRFAVPAGAVYFLNKPLANPPSPGSLCRGEEAATGWGAFLEGVWDYV